MTRALLALRLLTSLVFFLFIAGSSAQDAQRNLASLHGMMGKGSRLQDIDSFGGQPTRGYTVDQWNALIALPDAKGLGPVFNVSDQIDEVAIQATINASDARNDETATLIDLPAGTFRLNRPIKSGCKPLVVHGAGTFSTSLVQTSKGQDGWHHGTADTACRGKYYSKITIEDIQILATGGGGAALVLDMNPSSGGLTLRDVGLHGVGNMTDNFWHDGIICNNCSVSVFNNVNISGIIGGDIAKTGTGLSFAGNGASIFDWYGGTINGFDTGVAATSGQGQDLEGFIFDGLNMDNVNTGFHIKWSSGMQSPQWYIINGQYGNIGKTWIDASGVSEIEIANNLTYSTAPAIRLVCQTKIGSRTLTGCVKPKDDARGVAAGHFLVSTSLPPGTRIVSLSGDSIETDAAALSSLHDARIVSQPQRSTPFVTLSNVRNLIYRDNKEEFGSSAARSNNVDNVISIKDSVNSKIYANVFGDYGSVMSGGFVDRGGNRDLIERDNSFSPWRTSIPRCVGCLSSGVTARWSIFYAGSNCELGSAGFVTCHGSSVGQLDASRQASIQFPSPMFLQPPTVDATNGDYAALAAPCGPVASTVTERGFAAKCTAGVAGWPVRINWTAIGR